AGAQQLRKFLESNLGKKRQVVVEQKGVGRTEHFVAVKLDCDLLAGSLADIMVTGVEGERLAGALIA
ncbi:MAG: tRNA (N(6)-L-threonylcarbamoyladenosine(37)-C(2))-methylthiotransferase MtaB, partial [Proteobacteria bacterium]|nr:tRNA (N(6)-L-threonylcarbamoyladenosine(37)-C(2))-methylthiotransferase MtaB [Pseudomonadota bacterium]